MTDFSGSDLDQMLGDARKTLESMRQGDAKPPLDQGRTHQAEQIEGTGEAADGRVRVTAASGGRITKVHLDPRAMRMASEDLAEQFAVAANAALDDLRSKAAGAVTDQVVDTAVLSKQVEQLQNEGLRQMAVINQAITETLSRIGGRR